MFLKNGKKICDLYDVVKPPQKVCCYARLRDVGFFETHEFYKTDIAVFRELGYEVIVTNSLPELFKQDADLYYGWWFGYGIFPVLVAKLRRKRVFISGVLHTLDCGGLNSWPFLKRLTMKLVMKIADCSILCSQGEFERLNGFSPRSCAVVPLTINSAIYDWPKDEHESRREPFILMITQLNKENVQRKMVVESICAFAIFHQRHSQFRLKICGQSGDGFQIVQNAVRDCGLLDCVDFLGRISVEHKRVLLGKAFAYLQPSACEGFGLALGEALACGTPVVTSPEICILSTYGDAVFYGNSIEALADRLDELTQSSSIYQTRQKLGYKYVQKYSFENRKERFRELIEKIVSGDKRAARFR